MGVRFLCLATSALALALFASSAPASVKQEVYVSGTVEPFGGYTFTGGFEFAIREPGEQTIGSIAVDGLYNGEYPWIMRIYTDNLHFAGVAGAILRPSPSGLVSRDGRFSVGLKVTCPNFGPNVWRRIPDLSDPDYEPYQPSVDPQEPFPTTDCVLMGIDPRNAAWVAGPDGLLYTDDDNVLGDITIQTPFEITFRIDAPQTAVKGQYDAFLYIEVVPTP